MPLAMVRPQAVVIGDKVYVSGGAVNIENDEDVEDNQQVFQYDPSRDEWNHLPPHHVFFFAMAQFSGHLITVGGGTPFGTVTGNVYRFKEKWEEFLTPMPTARFFVSVATTQSAIVASGGMTGVDDMDDLCCCATVEVYSCETSQWYTADPLPAPCSCMTSVTIGDTWYQLGGGDTDGHITTAMYTPLTTLIQKAMSPAHEPARHKSALQKLTSLFHNSTSRKSVWKTLPDTPLKMSAAATLSGNLLAVGGYGHETSTKIFLPEGNSWVSATTGDLPTPRHGCTAVQLSSNQLLVVGGFREQGEPKKSVFLGSMTT